MKVINIFKFLFIVSLMAHYYYYQKSTKAALESRAPASERVMVLPQAKIAL